MKTKEQLEQEVSRKTIELRALERQLYEIKLEGVLPTLKEKYEGKHFKCNAGIGNEEFLTYYQCKQVVDLSNAIVNSFEKSSYACEFAIGSTIFISMLEIEISKEEYESALSKFREQFNQL